jgi:hypothetical protein
MERMSFDGMSMNSGSNKGKYTRRLPLDNLVHISGIWPSGGLCHRLRFGKGSIWLKKARSSSFPMKTK